jgi:hypothetical protein
MQPCSSCFSYRRLVKHYAAHTATNFAGGFEDDDVQGRPRTLQQ